MEQQPAAPTQLGRLARVRAMYDKFCVEYAKTGNGKQSAIAAGYSPRTAVVQASRLLRRPRAQALIIAQNVHREVHAEQTYRNLISVAGAAIDLLVKTIKDESVPRKERVMVIECAGRQLERLARIEGLLKGTTLAEAIEAGRGGAAGLERSSIHLTLQTLVQTFEQHYHAAKEGQPQPPSQAVVSWSSIIEGSNGHGENGNGNGGAAPPPPAASPPAA